MHLQHASSSSSPAAASKDAPDGGAANAASDADGNGGRASRSAAAKKKKKGKRGKDDDRSVSPKPMDNNVGDLGPAAPNDFERDEGSIFGQTTGSSNATWVECDKCGKVRHVKLKLCVRSY